MKSEKKIISFRNRNTKALFFIVVISYFSISWDSVNEQTKQDVNTVRKQIAIETVQPPVSTIQLEHCFFTADQIKSLLIADVRKIMLQFVNDGSSKTVLVAYGLDKKNKKLTGPVTSSVVPGSTSIPIPKDGILGNLMVRRGQLKELFGHREGKHERIDETKITDVLFKPQATLRDNHVWYSMNKYGIIGPAGAILLADIPVNPCPPAKPCVDCEDYQDDN